LASPADAPPEARRRLAGLAVLIVSAVALVYAPVARHEFINFDDNLYVTDNPMVRAGLGADGVRWAFTTHAGGHWHPFTWLSFMADVQLFGVRAGPMLLENAALHAANAVLVLLLLVRMTGRVLASGFVAGVFALHPLRVESVAWVVERKDVLSTLFLLLALLAYVAWARRGRKTAYLACALAFAAGLLVKPTIMTLPALLVLLDFWPLGRLSRSRLASRLLEKVPLFVLSLASLAATFVAQSREGAVQPTEGVPAGQRLANALIAYPRYVAKTFWPSGLAPFYPLRPVSLVAAAAAAAGLVAAAAVAWKLRARMPWIAVGLAWFVIGLLPVAGLVQIGGQAIADRFTYVPQIGLLVALAWTAAEWAQASSARRAAAAGLAGASLAACAALSARQVSYWRDSVALFSHTLDVTSGNFLAHTNLGEALERRGQEAEARRHYEQAVAIHPGYAEARNNLGASLARAGDLKAAVPEFEAALARSPRLVTARNNLGLALIHLGEVPAAAQQYAEAVRQGPTSIPARAGLADALTRLGRLEEAAEQWEAATQLAPGWVDAQLRLAEVSAKLGRPDRAARAYEAAGRPDLARSLRQR